MEVGIAHPTDIALAAGVAESVGSAARAHLSKMSNQGMTGSSHNFAATGPVDTFNYQGFADKVDSASEKALDQVGDVTHKAVQAARKQVLTEAGLTTGGTGAATGAATGGDARGEEMEATGTEASSGAEAEEAASTVEEETGGATGSTGNEAESLVDELRKGEGAKSATGLETDGATGAEPENNPTGSEDDDTTGSTGGTGGTGGTGATGATAGGDGHWQWINKAHSGSTVKRHSDLLSTQ